jgi:hypothetical protein
VGESGVVRGETEMAGESEIKSSTHTIAVDGGDYGLGTVFNRGHNGLSEGGEACGLGSVKRGDFRKFRARTKTNVSARDYGSGYVRGVTQR